MTEKVCRVCEDPLTPTNTTPSFLMHGNNICKDCHNSKLRERYRTDPEYKMRRKLHQKTFLQTHPDIYKKGKIPVTDCLDKDVPVSFETLLDRSKAGKVYARIVLNKLTRIGLIEHLIPDSYRIVSSNPLRYALDGYYREASTAF